MPIAIPGTSLVLVPVPGLESGGKLLVTAFYVLMAEVMSLPKPIRDLQINAR